MELAENIFTRKREICIIGKYNNFIPSCRKKNVLVHTTDTVIVDFTLVGDLQAKLDLKRYFFLFILLNYV